MFDNVNLMIEEFYKVFYEIEELMLKQGIKCLTTTELHVIEAIGNSELTMNELSDKLGITMGTATVAVNKLNDKGFIKRERSNDDRRKVFVTLSKKGLEALKYHDLFHKTIIAKITKDLSQKELEDFTNIFSKILKDDGVICHPHFGDGPVRDVKGFKTTIVERLKVNPITMWDHSICEDAAIVLRRKC